MTAPNLLRFFLSPPHPCAYLEGREAVNLFADPAPLDNHLYSHLARQGFRRSGGHVYRPACDGCEACISVRIPVRDYHPRRRDRRCLARNRDLVVRLVDDDYREEHFRLYQRYIASRHPGGGMDDPDPAQYRGFLTSPWSETLALECRLDRRLLAVAVTDLLDDGLSAVYTFYEPELPRRSLGRFAILAQIQQALAWDLPYLYLGYWVAGCRKMAYKHDYQPLEGFVDRRWRPL